MVTCGAEVAIQVHVVFLTGHLWHLLPGGTAQWWGCHREGHSRPGTAAAEHTGGVTGLGEVGNSSRHHPWQREGPAGLAGASPARQ